MDLGAQRHANSREELLAAANTPEALAAAEALRGFLEMCDNEDDRAVRRPHGDGTHRDVAARRQHDQHSVHSPEHDGARPCVYYIHGGGMQSMSCYYGNYRAWGRMIAAQGVAVAMVDFRNALTPSSVDQK